MLEMRVSIRLSRIGDLEEITSMINGEHQKSNAVMEVDDSIVKKWIKNKNSVVAVAEGKVVGHEALDIWPESGWVELRSAVVLEKFRGNGIGYKMTRMLVSRFSEKNPDTIFVAVKNRTERGNSILLSMGFEEIKLEDVPRELFKIRSHSERKAFKLETKR